MRAPVACGFAIAALFAASAFAQTSDPSTFTPQGEASSHVLQLRLYYSVEEVLRSVGETQLEPHANGHVQPGAQLPRVRDIAAALNLPIGVFFVRPGRDFYRSIQPSPHYVEISEFVAMFASDTALAWHMAHEYAHLVLGHHFIRVAHEYRIIESKCPQCVVTHQPAMTLLHRNEETARLLTPVRHAHEFEADQWAVKRLLDHGFSVRDGFSLYLDVLDRKSMSAAQYEEESATHPSTRARVEAVDRLLATIAPTTLKREGLHPIGPRNE